MRRRLGAMRSRLGAQGTKLAAKRADVPTQRADLANDSRAQVGDGLEYVRKGGVGHELEPTGGVADQQPCGTRACRAAKTSSSRSRTTAGPCSTSEVTRRARRCCSSRARSADLGQRSYAAHSSAPPAAGPPARVTARASGFGASSAIPVAFLQLDGAKNS